MKDQSINFFILRQDVEIHKFNGRKILEVKGGRVDGNSPTGTARDHICVGLRASTRGTVHVPASLVVTHAWHDFCQFYRQLLLYLCSQLYEHMASCDTTLLLLLEISLHIDAY